jgi:Flp pilus assembly protein TadG
MKRWPTVATPMEPRSKALDAENEGSHRGSGVSIGDEEGAALVEMALSAAVFLTILIGMVYLIFGLYVYNFVADAAREASRYASTRGSQCVFNTRLLDCNAGRAQIQSFVQSMPYPGLNANNLTVTTTWMKANTTGTTGWTACARRVSCNQPGDMVQVRVTYGYPINVPFWTSTTIDVSSASQMVISQ